jgi:hypothetical protein
MRELERQAGKALSKMEGKPESLSVMVASA